MLKDHGIRINSTLEEHKIDFQPMYFHLYFTESGWIVMRIIRRGDLCIQKISLSAKIYIVFISLLNIPRIEYYSLGQKGSDPVGIHQSQ